MQVARDAQRRFRKLNQRPMTGEETPKQLKRVEVCAAKMSAQK